eukprot:scaffold146705_cov32-Tisochrysis_lutea.AAC.1
MPTSFDRSWLSAEEEKVLIRSRTRCAYSSPSVRSCSRRKSVSHGLSAEEENSSGRVLVEHTRHRVSDRLVDGRASRTARQ